MDRKSIELIKQFVEKVKKDFLIERVIFFGSRAGKNYFEHSDIDLLIVSDDFKDLNFFERVSKMYDYWNVDLPVDFLCYTNKEFEKLSKMITIVKEAVRNGIVIEN